MKKITINGTELNVIKAYIDYAYKSHSLVIEIDQSEIDVTTLKNVFETNKGDIVYTDDDSTQIYCGYTQGLAITIKNDKYYIKLASVEALEQKIATLESENKSLKAQISTLNDELLNTQLAVVELYENNVTEEA